MNQHPTVTRSTGQLYQVRLPDGQTVTARLKGKLRLKELKTTNPVAVGDWVRLEHDEAESHFIAEVLPRKNYIIRRSTNLSHQGHVLASNIDNAFLVATLSHPRTTTAFIDRFLVTAEAYRIPTTLLFNKMDLYDEQEQAHLRELVEVYEDIGYRCLALSALRGTGLEQLAQWMRGKVRVVSRHSGVGKSTLINALDPSLSLRVGEISDYHHKGKHTTTFSEMVELATGGFLIDTPGIKGFGMVEMKKAEIAHYFPEMFALLEHCRYGNCTHLHEPGCAVKDALAEGLVSESRYLSYISLMEDDDKYRPVGY